MFRASEVIELACKIEANGEALYRAMAQETTIVEVRDLLEQLAAAERQHVADFQQIGRGLDYYESAETYPGEYDEYAQALVDTNVFCQDLDIGQLIKEAGSDLGMIQLALRFEKESILFLTTFRSLVFAAKEARAVEALINQEHEHIIKLVELQQKLVNRA